MAGYSRAKPSSPITVFSALFWLVTRIGLPLLLLYGLLWWRASVAIDKQLNNLSGMVDIHRSGTVLGLNGDVGIRNIRITPVEGRGLPALTLRAKRAVLQTPSLWWLVRTSLFGMPKEIPSRLGFRLDEASIDGDPAELDKALVGGHVVFPFDLAGCDTEMNHDVLRALGSESATISFEMTMTHPTAQLIRFHVSTDRPGMMGVDGELNMSLGSDSDLGRQFGSAAFEGMQVVYTDEGFTANRNAYCQKRTGLSAEQFVAKHVDAASASFASKGIKPGAALTEAYAGFARTGGRLTFAAQPATPVPLAKLSGADLETLGFLLHATVRHDDGSTGALTFLPADSNVAAIRPASFSAREIPVSATRDASISSPRVAVGAEIPYADLGAYLGDQVEVATNINSKRRGTLQGTSLMGVSLKASAEEGGYTLSVPKYTIVNVVLVAPAADLAETGSKNAQAK